MFPKKAYQAFEKTSAEMAIGKMELRSLTTSIGQQTPIRHLCCTAQNAKAKVPHIRLSGRE
jgi:hypothetical protein